MTIKDATLKMTIKSPTIRLKLFSWFMALLVLLRIVKPEEAVDWMMQKIRKHTKYRIGNGEWQTLKRSD
jgi:hypothetical protein